MGLEIKREKKNTKKGKPALSDQRTGKIEANRDLVGIPKHFSTNKTSREGPIHQQPRQQQSLLCNSGQVSGILSQQPQKQSELSYLLLGPREWSHLTVITVAKPSDSPASTQWHKRTKSSGFFPQSRRLPLTPQMAPVGVEQES